MDPFPETTTFVSIVVSQDSATGLPTSLVRERHAFETPELAAIYHAALLAWVAQMPSPESVGLPPLSPDPLPEKDLDEILAPILVDDEPGVYDWQRERETA